MKQSREAEEIRPDPDPTVLTTDQLRREISSLRELIEARLHGMDKAIDLSQAAVDRLPAHVAGAVGRVQELHEEKFSSIEKQFIERDTRTEQASKDSKVAIDAALSAQKESVDKQNTSNTLAVNKSEASFTKQVDEIGKRIDAVGKSLDEKVADIKERLTSIESRSNGVTSQKQETDRGWMVIFGAVGTIIGIIGIVVVIAKIVT